MGNRTKNSQIYNNVNLRYLLLLGSKTLASIPVASRL